MQGHGRITWTHEEASHARVVFSATPGIEAELLMLSEGNLGLKMQIVKRVALGLAQTPAGFNFTAEGLRKLAGAPIDNAELPSWRKGLSAERETHRETQRRPRNPESR